MEFVWIYKATIFDEIANLDKKVFWFCVFSILFRLGRFTAVLQILSKSDYNCA
jgi:hypothetical protein